MKDLKDAFGKGEYLAFTLSNGMQIVAVRDDGAPIVRGTIIVHAGAKDTPDTGIAHYFEHIMFKGTDEIGTVDFPKEKAHLDRIEALYEQLSLTKNTTERKRIQSEINAESIQAAKYAIPGDFANLVGKYGGSRLNAATGYDYTRYDHNFTPEYFRHWCLLNAERLLKPVFRLFQSELETVYEEKNMYAGRVGTREQEIINHKKAFPHPYAYPIIGNTESLLNPNLKEMRAFYEKYYVPGNMGIVLTGPLPSEEEMRATLEETFGKLVRREVVRNVNPSPKPFGFKERMYVRSAMMHAKTATLIWHTVPLGHPDLLPIQVLQEMLNNESKTGFLDRLVLDNVLPSAVAFHSALREMGTLSIYLMPQPGRQSYSDVEKLAIDILGELQKESETNKRLFDRVRLSLLRTQYLNLEGHKTRHSVLVNLMKEGSSIEELGEEIARLRSMKYSEIIRVIQTYLGDHYLDVRERKGKYPVEHIPPMGYAPIPASNEGAVSHFAKKLSGIPLREKQPVFAPLSEEAAHKEIDGNPLVKLYHTENGLNEIFSLDLLYFRKRRGHTATALLPEYLEMIGAGGLSANVFFEKLQDLGATLNFASREDSFLVSLTGFDERFEETVKLLGLFLTEPNSTPEVLVQEQINFRLNLQTGLQTETTLFAWAFQTVTRGKEARMSRIFDPKEVGTLTVQDLHDELHEILSTEVDVHYAGSIPPKRIQEILSESHLFSEVAQKGDSYAYFAPLKTTAPCIYTLQDPHRGVQSMIGTALGFGRLSEDDEHLLEFYTYYLGGNMGSLLFQEIREFRSLAYAVQSYPVTPYPGLRPTSEKQSALLCQTYTRTDKTEEVIRTLEGLIKEAPKGIERVRDAQAGFRGEVSSGFPDTFRIKTRQAALLLRSGYSENPALWKIRLAKEHPDLLLSRLQDFHKRVILKTPIVHLVFGNSEEITPEKYGVPVRALQLEDITKLPE